ncbi:MAG: hypothetical protein M3457_06810 [Chloroflexota bacterium]|nr:hypothetical protein [Chloroflexota bacterium]
MPAERSRTALPTRQIFRPEAMRRHVQANSQPVFPRFTTPLAVACCWLLVGLLGVSAGFAWLSRVPVTSSGPVIVTAGDDDPGDKIALVFLAPDRASDVRVGDDVVLQFGTQTVIRPLLSLEPVATSPAALQRRFGLTNDAAQVITRPSIVGMVRLEASRDGMSAVVYPGATGRAEVEVGSERVAAFLPVVGRFLR